MSSASTGFLLLVHSDTSSEFCMDETKISTGNNKWMFIVATFQQLNLMDRKNIYVWDKYNWARKRTFFPSVINTDSDSPTSADSDRQVDIKPLSLAVQVLQSSDKLSLLHSTFVEFKLLYYMPSIPCNVSMSDCSTGDWWNTNGLESLIWQWQTKIAQFGKTTAVKKMD